MQRGRAPKKGVFSSRGSRFKKRRKNQRTNFTARGLTISKLIALVFRMTNPRRKASKTNPRRFSWKHGNILMKNQKMMK